MKKKTERIGEENVMFCGMLAKIIDYRNCSDIDIQFADGAIVKNTTYYIFKQGHILSPNLKEIKGGNIK